MSAEVSVIIPVYNSENSISISLDSLLNQTYTDFEVIIIDDGSNDDSRKKIEEYLKEDNRFTYFRQNNKGVSSARNRGLELADGKYICFLDSDDFYESTYIEKMINKIKSKEADICYCGYSIISPEGKKIRKMKFTTKNLLVNYILGKVNIHTTSWMIRKEIIEANSIRFPIEVSWGEDFEFFCEVLSSSKKDTFVDEYLTNYRVFFEDDKLSSFSMEKLEEDFRMIQRVVNNIKINSNFFILKSLLEYRLQSLLVYRLLIAFKMGVDNTVILSSFNKYEPYFKKTSWVNGLKSLKLNIYKFHLKIKIKRLRRKNKIKHAAS